MAYCMVLLVPLRLNRVTYLYCRIFGFQRTQKGENKKPFIYQVTTKGFYNQNHKTFSFLLYCTILWFRFIYFLCVISLKLVSFFQNHLSNLMTCKIWDTPIFYVFFCLLQLAKYLIQTLFQILSIRKYTSVI